jgi:hypothetical protein
MIVVGKTAIHLAMSILLIDLFMFTWNMSNYCYEKFALQRYKNLQINSSFCLAVSSRSEPESLLFRIGGQGGKDQTIKYEDR